MTSRTHTFDVPGISCEHCKRAIEDKVGPVAGVESVSVDIDTKTVAVAGGDEEAITAAISAAGYAVA